LADFILALDEVDVVVVGSKREDGIKLSVRSELSEVNAGALVYEAVKDIGNGGGHAFMAGGFVSNSALEKLGGYSESVLRDRFTKELEKVGYFRDLQSK